MKHVRNPVSSRQDEQEAQQEGDSVFVHAVLLCGNHPAAGMTGRNRGTTAIELLVAAVILALIMGAVYKLTSAGQKSAIQIMQSHQVNEEIQSAIDHFSDDVREGNVILDAGGTNIPFQLPLGSGQAIDDALNAAIQAKTLKTEDPVNKVRLMKCQVLPPNQVSGGTVSGMVKKTVVEYFFKVTGDTCALIRKYVELDPATNAEVPASARIRPIINGINITKDYAVFFRISGNPSVGARNIFFAADIARKEKKADGTLKDTFHATVLTSARIRGSAPDKY